jgi:hypothetical protein
LGTSIPEPADPSTKAGRVLSAKSEALITAARDALDECLAQVAQDSGDDSGKGSTREPRLVVLADPSTEPRKFIVNPETVQAVVAETVAAEVARRRGRLD